MKKILFITFTVLLAITACKKDEPETLAGTSWKSQMALTHNEGDKPYTYTRDIELNFFTSTNGAVVLKKANLPDNIVLDEFVVLFTYAFDFKTDKGVATFLPNEEKGEFSISGNTLKFNVQLQPGFSFNVDFTKK